MYTVEKLSMIALDGDCITKEFLDDYENIAPYISVLFTAHSSTVDDWTSVSVDKGCDTRGICGSVQISHTDTWNKSVR